MTLNVFALGASKNIGYHAALRLPKQGATVTYLLRRTSVFDEDVQVQPYIKSGKARLVSGDGLKAEDVAKAWQAALDAGNGKIDYVVFSIGGAPIFTMSKGFIIDPPDLCTRSLLNLFTTAPESLRAPENQPRFVIITSNGITTEAHAKLPLAMKPIYNIMLPAPHADKLGMERILARTAGREWATRDEVSAEILPAGWQNIPGLWEENGLKHLVIIRPAMLTDGGCRGDELLEKDEKREGKGKDRKGKVPYRTLANDEMCDGYRVSRQDVAHLIVEDALPNWSKWEGTAVNLAY